MDWQETQRRLLEGLYDQVRSRWGRIGETEARLGISDGYLGKLCRGKHDFKLSLFLEAIEALGLDHRAFFSQALEIQPEPEDYLRQLDETGDRDSTLARMAGATRELETATPPAADRRATAGAEAVAGVAACRRVEQLRRLRAGRKYRSHAFARAYLEHLDALRYDDAGEAARLAAGVAQNLIPALPGPQQERVALQCLALGVYGSARRLEGRFSAAARTFNLALEVARRTGLRRDTANLLLRASYLLKDHGQFRRALAFLNEALVTFVQLGAPWDIGRALVDHGMMRSGLGQYQEAVLDLERAIEHLAGSEKQLNRHHLSAYQLGAYAHEQLGRLVEAHQWLERGLRIFEPRHAVDIAKLQWFRGRLAFRQGRYGRAQELLRAAGAGLVGKEIPTKRALLTVDLISVLLAQGRRHEASDLAAAVVPPLFDLRSSHVAEATIAAAALDGKLHEDIVPAVRAKLMQRKET